MKIAYKFNIILALVFIAGILVEGWASYSVTQKNAYDHVKDQAMLMMEQSSAVRNYTVNEVRPALKKDGVFHPQSVPAYSATQVANIVKNQRPAYQYKEAVLNPTNLRDKATGWEKEVINKFRANGDMKESEGEVNLHGYKLFYFAKPIKITNSKCLACHSEPERAPEAMLASYGSENGFGWKLGETVGMQMVTVPLGFARDAAEATFWDFVTSMVTVFIAIFIVLNILIYRLVLRPISDITKRTDEISRRGLKESEELEVTGNDEISQLARSFNRMFRSTIGLMKVIEKKHQFKQAERNKQ